jgi:branched-chain amino acid transport system ATP-binding protein
MSEQPILQLAQVRKSFGGVVATAGVDFTLEEREFVAVIGPNGAGKSTFFNLITGEHAIDSGSIRFRGEEIAGQRPDRIARRGIARAFQVSNLFGSMTCRENVRQAIIGYEGRAMEFFRPAAGIGREEVDEILDACGLGELREAEAGSLSQGDKKRLELAIALGMKPRLLLLDEPTAGMSSEESREIMQLIGRINRERGLSIVFTEHDMGLVFGFAERIVVLHQGAVIAQGKPEEVRANRMVQDVYLGGAI